MLPIDQNATRYYFKAIYEVDTNLTTGLTLNLNIRGGTTIAGCDFTIDWGDGTSIRYTSLPPTPPSRTYASHGIYTVTLDGFVPNLGWAGLGIPNATNLGKIRRFTTMGDVHQFSLTGWFYNCPNIIEVPSTLPPFRYGTSFTLLQTFRNATSFNQDLSGWDVSIFNSLNQMFQGATSFNQNLGMWQLRVAGVTMTNMLDSCGMSEDNYSRTLIGWANYVFENDGPINVPLGAIGRQYSDITYTTGNTYNDAVSARNYLISRGWTISGDSRIDYLLTENNSFLLLENGNKLLLEA